MRHYYVTYDYVNRDANMTATMAQLRTTLTIQMAMDRQLIAARVIALRNRNGLTQEALRDKSGLSLRTIQRIEKPDPKKLTEIRHSTVDALAKALGVEAREITEDTAVVKDDPPTATPDLIGQMSGDRTEIAELREQLGRMEEAIAELRELVSLSASPKQRGEARERAIARLQRDARRPRATRPSTRKRAG